MCICISFSIINQNKPICFNSSVENFFEVLENNTESTFEINIRTTMYDGKARNAIIEGNDDGKVDSDNEPVIDR